MKTVRPTSAFLMTQKMLSAAELAIKWGCSEKYVRSLIRSDRLPSVRVGPRSIRIRSEVCISHDALRFEEKQRPSFVYVLKAGDFVKIGWTSSIEDRVSDLSTASPFKVELLFYTEGGRRLEMKIHKLFADYRHHREWFRYEGEIKKWVDAECSRL